MTSDLPRKPKRTPNKGPSAHLNRAERKLINDYLAGKIEQARTTKAKFDALPRGLRNDEVREHIRYWKHVIAALKWALYGVKPLPEPEVDPG